MLLLPNELQVILILQNEPVNSSPLDTACKLISHSKFDDPTSSNLVAEQIQENANLIVSWRAFINSFDLPQEIT